MRKNKRTRQSVRPPLPQGEGEQAQYEAAIAKAAHDATRESIASWLETYDPGRGDMVRTRVWLKELS